MQHLWSPWRVQYIRRYPQRGCFFCRYIRQNRDRENLIVVRSRRCFCIMNRFPYNSGHLMVAPMAHKGELSQLSSLEFSELFKLMLQMIKLLKRVMRPQGFNVGLNLGHVAGAGAKGHLHIHIVPRWEADTNFMPVISDTKVVSQSLQQLYEQLVSPD